MNPALLSSNMEHWLSPPDFLAIVDEVHGETDLDPCDNRASIVTATAHCYVGERDGLRCPWTGRVYVNCPYGTKIGLWTARMRQCGGELRSCEIIGLLPARVDTSWCQRDVFASANAWCFWSGRLTFWRAWEHEDLAQRLNQAVANLRPPDPFRVLPSGILVGPDLDKTGNTSPAPFPSLVPYWGKNPVKFARVFRRHGVVSIRTGDKRGTYSHQPRRAA